MTLDELKHHIEDQKEFNRSLRDVLQLELVKEYVAIVLSVLHLQVIALLRDMLNDLGL